METRRSADYSSSQMQQLEETLSNLRLSHQSSSSSSSTYYPNHNPYNNLIYNPPVIAGTMQQQPIFNPSPIHPPMWFPAPPPPPPPVNPYNYFTAAEAQQNLMLGPTMEIKEMMTHPTESYFVQTLIDGADEDNKRNLLAMIIHTKFLLQKLCCDTHGTRVVQKLIESMIDRDQKKSLTLALQPIVLHLSFNEIGRHVIVQCIRNFSDAENQPILREVGRNVFAMGRHKSGYLVLTECVSCHHCGPNLALLLDRVAENALLLSHDQYGNYVVQHALDLNMPRLTSNILARLQGNLAVLSASKYGSNVVEKCLKVSRRDQCCSIIDELLHSPDISRLVLHSYGNYVIQTSLTLSKNFGLEIQHSNLLALLRMNMGELKISQHGKRLIKWLSNSSR